MYNDPQSVTLNSTATNLARVPSPEPEKKGVFSTSAGDFNLSVTQHKSKNRFRREVRITEVKVAADPISAENKEVSASAILTIDEPRWGFDDADLANLTTALTTWFTDANRDDLFEGQV